MGGEDGDGELHEMVADQLELPWLEDPTKEHNDMFAPTEKQTRQKLKKQNSKRLRMKNFGLKMAQRNRNLH